MFGFRKRIIICHYTDEDLIQEYSKDTSSIYLEELYNRYAHIAFGIALHYLKNSQDAEDCVMNFFEKLPIQLTKHSITSFKPWMYRVVKNDCFMLLRKRKSVIYQETIPVDYEIIEQEPVESVEHKINALLSAFSELKLEQRKALELFYFNKYSYEEIANLLQVSTHKVKSAIQNGKRNLKLKLEGNHVFKQL